MPYVGVCEGYATGLTVFMATGATVIVAFDANGIKGKAERLNTSFLGKRLAFFGDNDGHKNYTGNEAAHIAALKTNGLVIIPLQAGDDWDDFRKNNGIEATKNEINRQLSEYGRSVGINDYVTGLSITSSIYITN